MTSLSVGQRSVSLKLFVASTLGLFVELALIRWLPAAVHVVGFFANLVLIASFLGLGLGLARPFAGGDPAWQALFRTGLLMAAGVLLAVIDPPLALSNPDYAINEAGLGHVGLPFALVLLAVFCGSVWAMIPYGRLIGRLFDSLPALGAYTVNVAGSLLGVVLFALCSSLGIGPIGWFGIVLAGLLPLGLSLRHLLPAALVMVSVVGLNVIHSKGDVDVRWSPYYELRVSSLAPDAPLDEGFVMDVNGQFLLSGLDVGTGSVPPGTSDRLRDQIEVLPSYYDFPFVLRDPGQVLILGAGAGNDVAAALRSGATSVTAVEIDPAVAWYGQAYHPEDPYTNGVVRLVIDDARSFLRTTEDRFDTIVFATLDAHGLLSSSSSVRIDSFVYTEQSLTEAREVLDEAGVLVLSFGPFREDVQFRQWNMVREVFGQEPLYFEHANGHRTIVAGDLGALSPELGRNWRAIPAEEIAAGIEQYPYALTPATDDWPFVYLTERRIPREYIAVLLGMVVIAMGTTARAFRGTSRFSPHFFFLGAGFLLMETKSVVEVALLIGSTWQTNAAVFSSVLVLALAANLTVQRWPRIPRWVPFVGLGVMLGAQVIAPVGSWADGSTPGGVALAVAYVTAPVFFGGLVFAQSMARVRSGSGALASNLLGAVVGGVLEYSSLVFGLRSSTILAVAMYALAGLTLALRAPRSTSVAESAVRSAQPA